jgi:hypothetical protein
MTVYHDRASDQTDPAGAGSTSGQIELTLFVNAGNAPLSKRIWVDGDGKVQKRAAAEMVAGSAHRLRLTVADLGRLIENMPAHHAIARGALRADLPNMVGVVTAERLNGAPNVIARTKEFLQFRPGEPAIALLDYDSGGMSDAVRERIAAAGGFFGALRALLPGLETAGHIIRGSISAGPFSYRGQVIAGSDGKHVLVTMADGADNERFLKALHARAWLKGFGWGMVAKGGKILQRSIIDAVVFTPERLVFEGAPDVVAPLVQDPTARRPVVVDGPPLDTRVAAPDLSAKQRAELAKLVEAERARLAPEAGAARDRYVEEEAPKIAKGSGISIEKARAIAGSVTGFVLPPEAILEFADGETPTVAEVLKDPAHYLDRAMADPLEGPAYGRSTARLYRRAHDGTYFVNSFAHGGRTFELLSAIVMANGSGAVVALEDFWSCAPSGDYIFTPTREHWPACSVNGRLPPIPVLDENGQPVVDKRNRPMKHSASTWLDRNRSVEAVTWAPGEPEIVEGRLISLGGWFNRAGARTYNLYRPPLEIKGDAREADRWVRLVHKLYDQDAPHIIAYLAHRVQRPEEKINHGLVLGGDPGIGKDTLLEPVRYGVGPWNFLEVSPEHVMGRFNGWVRCVLLRINEARDQGTDAIRFALYEHMKIYTAAPPPTLRCDEKFTKEFYVLNCMGVVITTNYPDALYLPPTDRRYHVNFSEVKAEHFGATKEERDAYWNAFWRWYEHGGIGHVVAYLKQPRLLDGFNPKAPPPKTDAFQRMVDAARAPDAVDLSAVIADMGNPAAFTLDRLRDKVCGTDAYYALHDPKRRRQIPHLLKECGYVPQRNPDTTHGKWKIEGRQHVIYARSDLDPAARLQAARDLVRFGRDKQAKMKFHASSEI